MLLTQEKYFDIELEDENIILYQGDGEGFVIEKTTVKCLVGLLSDWVENGK